MGTWGKVRRGKARQGKARRGKARWTVAALSAVAFVIVATTLTLLLVIYGIPPWNDGNGDGTGEGASGSRSAADARLGWGFTHTEYSADRGTTPATDRVGRLISANPMPQNQHIMGWGARNPNPRPGVYDFKDLDRRIELIRRTGGTPVLTLCCAPDWMKGGEPGATDWASLEQAPSPDHYDDFAELAGTIAERYPDVRHFVVWNEFKGFFDDDKNRWDYEGYTRLYNLVQRELKGIDKDIKVGGPYVVMDSYRDPAAANASDLAGSWGAVDQRVLDAITYWNENNTGADFLVVDGSSYSRENRYVPDEFSATRKFGDITRWLRKETGLPVWWAEWYVEVANKNDERAGWREAHRTAVEATAMIEMARAGTATGLYWNPQTVSDECPGCLWRGTQFEDGGGAMPMMRLLSRFEREFPPGTEFRSVAVAREDRPNVRVLADDDAVLVVNTVDRPIQAKIDGRVFDMDGYEVRWLRRG